MLPQFAAQSTALVCDDAPEEIGDIYRLLLVLWYSAKPVVTGAFSAETLRVMLDLLAAESGGARSFAAATAGSVRRLPVASAELGRIRRAEPGGPGAGRGAGGTDLHAARRSGRAGDADRVGRAARGRVAQRHRDPPAGAARGAGGLGRRAGHLRHAHRHHAHGRDRDRHAQCRVRPGGQGAGAADPRLPGRQRCQGGGRPGGHGERHGGHRGRAGGHQHDLGRRHARFSRLPQPGEAGDRCRVALPRPSAWCGASTQTGLRWRWRCSRNRSRAAAS